MPEPVLGGAAHRAGLALVLQCAALQIRADEEVAKRIRTHVEVTLASVHADQTNGILNSDHGLVQAADPDS